MIKVVVHYLDGAEMVVFPKLLDAQVFWRSGEVGVEVGSGPDAGPDPAAPALWGFGRPSRESKRRFPWLCFVPGLSMSFWVWAISGFLCVQSIKN